MARVPAPHEHERPRVGDGVSKPALVVVVTGPDHVRTYCDGTPDELTEMLVEVLATPNAAGMLVHFAADAVAPGGQLHERRGINGFAERADFLVSCSEPSALSECPVCGVHHAGTRGCCPDCERGFDRVELAAVKRLAGEGAA